MAHFLFLIWQTLTFCNIVILTYYCRFTEFTTIYTKTHSLPSIILPYEVNQQQKTKTKVTAMGHVSIFISKRGNSLVLKVKVNFKARPDSIQIGLLYAYKLINFEKNINGSKDDKKFKGHK